MAKPIMVTLVRSPIGKPRKHRRILQALGLTKVNKSRVLYATPTVVGAIKKVVHLVDVQEFKE